jgi:hypothetical protein
LAGEGVKAVRSAPTSKRRKKTAGQSELRDFPISSLPRSVSRTSRRVFEQGVVVRGEGDERATA